MRLSPALPVIALLAFAAPAMADEYVIMKVNGQDVSSSEAARFWEGLFPPGQAPAFDTVKPDVREKVLRGVMAEKLVMAEAQKQGIDKSELVTKQVEDMKRKLTVRTFLDIKTADSITEADIKKEYDAMVAANKDDKEVHARHILVPSEAEAKEARKQIDSGKSFEDVAKSLSKDPGSAKNGGDLGYFTKDKMVPEFANAAFAMKKGEISAPVKSSFGWHIIKVEDVRSIKAPEFKEVKDQLKMKLQDKKLNDYISGIVKTADVKVFDAKGKPMAFEKNLPQVEAAPAEKPAEKKAEPKPEKKPEPAKTEKKPEVKAEPAKAEPVKAEPAKAEPTKTDKPAAQ